MSPEYRRLAARRAATQWPPYLHPEDFGYDFRDWVSPHTKGAHATGGVALVLHDWASVEGLAGGPEPDIQHFGRIRDLLTNRRLEQLLLQVLGLRIDQVYITNAFPFIKPGGMSSSLPLRDVVTSIGHFCAEELVLAKPKVDIALGSLTHRGLAGAGIDARRLPHPAARGMNFDAHERAWRGVLLH